MPAILPNTATADDYPDTGGCQVGINDVFASGYFVVANAAVFAQYQHGPQGQQDFSGDIFLAPATYPLVGTPTDPLGGIRFKSAVAGTPAQVFGVLYKKDESSLLAGSEFGAQVSGAGTITPPAGGAVFITGRSNAAGVIISGTGFTVALLSVGLYRVTYTTPFSGTPPTIAVTIASLAAGSFQAPNITVQTVNGFEVEFRDGANALTSVAFNFLVTETV